MLVNVKLVFNVGIVEFEQVAEIFSVDYRFYIDFGIKQVYFFKSSSCRFHSVDFLYRFHTVESVICMLFMDVANQFPVNGCHDLPMILCA